MAVDQVAERLYWNGLDCLFGGIFVFFALAGVRALSTGSLRCVGICGDRPS